MATTLLSSSINSTIIFISIIFLFTSSFNSVKGVPDLEFESMLTALRSKGYNLFGNAITTSDIRYEVLAGTSFTFFAPTDGTLFALDMTAPASLYVSSLRYHIIHGRISFSDLKLLRSGFEIKTLFPDNSVIIRSKKTPESELITVNDVDVVIPGLFYGKNIAVHGLNGILDPRSRNRSTNKKNPQRLDSPANSSDLQADQPPNDQAPTSSPPESQDSISLPPGSHDSTSLPPESHGALFLSPRSSPESHSPLPPKSLNVTPLPPDSHDSISLPPGSHDSTSLSPESHGAVSSSPESHSPLPPKSLNVTPLPPQGSHSLPPVFQPPLQNSPTFAPGKAEDTSASPVNPPLQARPLPAPPSGGTNELDEILDSMNSNVDTDSDPGGDYGEMEQNYRMNGRCEEEQRCGGREDGGVQAKAPVSSWSSDGNTTDGKDL